jgi:hypothetical protein
MTERDRWGLRGPVQSCRLQRTWYARGCGADLCETEERGDTTLVEFHPNGALARRWHRNPDGSEWTSVYGALFGAGPARRLHRYDARGHRIETHTWMFGGLGRDSRTMTYNDHGDQIEEISEHEQRDFNIDDQVGLSDSPAREKVSRSEARFHDDYDARGNWIKKAIEARGGTDGEFFVSSIEHRTLAYDD